MALLGDLIPPGTGQRARGRIVRAEQLEGASVIGGSDDRLQLPQLWGRLWGNFGGLTFRVPA